MTKPTPDLPPIDPAILRALNGLPSDFAEFPRIFQDEIRPALAAREQDRQVAAKHAKDFARIGLAIGVIGVLVSMFALRVPALAIVSAVIGFGFFVYGRIGIDKISKEAKALLVEPIARQLALEFTSAPGPVQSIYDHNRVGIVPGWDRANYEDQIIGNRNGIDFEFFEAHLEDKRTRRDSNGNTRTEWVTVFNGQCIRFNFHKRFFGHTLVTRDMGMFNMFGGVGKSNMQRARLEDPTFEKAFEVYTTDQVEARFLLTPDLMQRLVDLENVFHGDGLRCAFEGGEMFIAIEGANLFEPGSMFTPLDNPDRIRELLDDFAAVFHLIDEVSARKRDKDDRGT